MSALSEAFSETWGSDTGCSPRLGRAQRASRGQILYGAMRRSIRSLVPADRTCSVQVVRRILPFRIQSNLHGENCLTIAGISRSKRPLVSTAFLGLLSALLFPTTVFAAEARGEWLVAKRTAHIRIVDCAGTLWGIVSQASSPGIDDKNPDPAKRSRSVLGMPVLLAMKPDGPNRWAGSLYNSGNGKTYTGGISLVGPDVLRVRGCVLGFLCGGEDWSRVETPEEQSPSDASTCSRPDLTAGQ